MSDRGGDANLKPLGIKFTQGAEFPHLPAGREPGGQSLRNRARRKFMSPLAGLVGTAMFAAGIWVAAGGRGARFDRQEELFGGLFFAAGGLLCIYGAWAMWEKGQPKRHPRLRGTTLLVNGDTVRRGHEVSVTFKGRRTNDDVLEVGLACDERYDREVHVYVKGVRTVIRETGEARVHEQWQAVPPGVGEQSFRFQVPVDAPYSYEGDCVSYAWRVSARAVRPLRKDARRDQPIWVQP
jgi:hypothetical protein